MKDSDKARELAINATRHLDDNGNEVYDAFCEAALMEMAQWKEQDVIDRVAMWMNDHRNEHGFIYSDIESFKEEIKNYE